ncbi:hypothetical protein BJX76DRAFT_363292 [Aspergillus varians]
MRKESARNQKSAAIRQRKPTIPYNAHNPHDTPLLMPSSAAQSDDNASLASGMTSSVHMLGIRSSSVFSARSATQERTPAPSQEMPIRAPKRHLRQESADIHPDVVASQERTRQLREANEIKLAQIEELRQRKIQDQLDKELAELQNN